MFSSEEIGKLQRKIKDMGRLASLIYRDVSASQIESALMYKHKFDADYSKQKGKSIHDTLEECALVIHEADRLLWRFAVFGMFHPEDPDIFAQYKKDINASVIFKVTQGEHFEIVGCALYGSCNGSDRQDVPYGFSIGLNELIKGNQVGEIDLISLAPTLLNDRSVWKHAILHCVWKLFCPKSTNLVLKQEVQKIVTCVDGASSPLYEDLLREIGFVKVFSTFDNVYVLEDIADLRLQVPYNKYCTETDEFLFGECQ